MAGATRGSGNAADTDPDRQQFNPAQFPPSGDQTNRSEVTQVDPGQPVPQPLSMEERHLPAPAGYTDVRASDDEGESARRSVQPVDDESHSRRSRRGSKNE